MRKRSRNFCLQLNIRLIMDFELIIEAYYFRKRKKADGKIINVQILNFMCKLYRNYNRINLWEES